MAATRSRGAMTSKDQSPAARRSRAEVTADFLAELADGVEGGARLGSRDELRLRCQVSVGTFNEALRILQSRGVLTMRPGPGGGLFAAQQPMARLGNSVLALDADRTSVEEAVRIRNALDPLLIEDTLWHGSPADFAGMREILKDMAAAAAANDTMRFVHCNWRLHASIARVSPHPVLRSLYTNLLDLIESHTINVLPTKEIPLPEYVRQRHLLHTALVDALADRDRLRALDLIAEHNATDPIIHPAADAGPDGPGRPFNPVADGGHS
jgi:DNA-binding FadR family transcriptional regulator